MFGRYSWEWCDINVLEGKTLSKIENKDNEEILFTTTEGEQYVMYHDQDCCESVYVEDIVGDLDELIGYPVMLAEEVSESGDNEWGSATWTFYKLATIHGDVTIRWYGESNGYYSESVSFVRVPKVTDHE